MSLFQGLQTAASRHLTARQLAVMVAVRDYPDYGTKQIGECLNLDRVLISQIADSLVEEGLLIKERSIYDARCRSYELTEDGVNLIGWFQ